MSAELGTDAPEGSIPPGKARPSLPLSVNDISDVPLELEAQYQLNTQTGKYEFMHVRPLKNALVSERTSAKTNEALAKKWQQAALHAYGSGISQEELDTLLQQPEALDRLLTTTHADKFRSEEGATSEAVDQKIKMALSDKEREFSKKERQLSTQLELSTRERDDYKNKWVANTVDQAYRDAVQTLDNGVTVDPTQLKLLLLNLRDDTYHEINEKGVITLYVKAPPGSPEGVPYNVNGMGNPMTVKELIEKEYMVKHPYLFLVPTAETGMGGGTIRTGSGLAGGGSIGQLRKPGDQLNVTREAVHANPQEALRQRKAGVNVRVRE